MFLHVLPCSVTLLLEAYKLRESDSTGWSPVTAARENTHNINAHGPSNSSRNLSQIYKHNCLCMRNSNYHDLVFHGESHPAGLITIRCTSGMLLTVFWAQTTLISPSPGLDHHQIATNLSSKEPRGSDPQLSGLYRISRCLRNPDGPKLKVRTSRIYALRRDSRVELAT